MASDALVATIMLAAGSFVAAYTDVARRRISNVLTFGLAAAAVAVSCRHGVLAAVLTVAIYLALLAAGTFPFSRGWIGGGDVKLLAAGAACAGWPGLTSFLLVTALAGGVLAVVELARAGRMRSALTQLATAAYVGCLANGVTLQPDRRKIPYALAILTGALYLVASETIAPWLQLVRG